MPLHPVDSAKLKTSGASTGSGPELRRLVKKNARPGCRALCKLSHLDVSASRQDNGPGRIRAGRDRVETFPGTGARRAHLAAKRYRLRRRSVRAAVPAEPDRDCATCHRATVPHLRFSSRMTAAPVADMFSMLERNRLFTSPKLRSAVRRQSRRGGRSYCGRACLRSHHLTVQSQDI
jgi:hypothetical protein